MDVSYMDEGIIKISESLEGLADIISGEKRVIAIVDRKVGELHHGVIPTSERIFIDASESAKTLETVSYIVSRLLEMEADRDVLLLGIGGGITTDVTGLVASVYKRGVRFALVPTTLLAQVDAAIGGKNGVNHRGFKNVIGAFNLPLFTWCNISFLKTLPDREFKNGLPELFKTLLIGDAEGYCEAVRVFGNGRGTDVKELCRFVNKAAMIKWDIVSRDFEDKGERMKLNFGHTFAHAIEKCAAEDGLDISHGEAVAAGMVIAARLSEKMGYAGKGIAARLEGDFSSAGLSVTQPFDMKRLHGAILNDKKRQGDFLSFAAIRGVGEVEVVKIKIGEVTL